MPQSDARLTKDFLNRQKQQDEQRREKAKALSEDQKKMSFIAQGLGLEKGEIDSMSRGELQGFIQTEMDNASKMQAREKQSLELAKFAQSVKVGNSQARTNEANAKTALMNANTSSQNSQTNYLSTLNKFQDDAMTRGKEYDTEQRNTNDAQDYKKFVSGIADKAEKGDPQANKWLNENKHVAENFYSGMSAESILGARGEPVEQQAPDKYHPQALKKLNDETAKDYAEFQDEGGNHMMEMSMRSMNQVIAELKKPGKTGGRTIDFFGDTLRRAYDLMTEGNSIAMQQQIDLITQANLKATLGAQFTEKEATLFLQRSYDPKGSDQENVDKLRQALEQVTHRANSRMSRYKYFEENNYSMEGFMTKNPGAFSHQGKNNPGNPNDPNSISTSSGNNATISIPGTQIDLK